MDIETEEHATHNDSELGHITGWVMRGLSVAAVAAVCAALLFVVVIISLLFELRPSGYDWTGVFLVVVGLPVVVTLAWHLRRARKVRRERDTPVFLPFLFGAIVVPALLTMEFWAGAIGDKIEDRRQEALSDRAVAEQVALFEDVAPDLDPGNPVYVGRIEHCDSTPVASYSRSHLIERPSWVRQRAEDFRAEFEERGWELRSRTGEIRWSDTETLVAVNDDVLIKAFFISGAENSFRVETHVGPCVEELGDSLAEALLG